LSSIAEPSSSEQFGRGLSARAERGRPCAVIRRGVSNASAQPCLADNAGDLLTDQPLDDAGEMVIEPGLQ